MYFIRDEKGNIYEIDDNNDLFPVTEEQIKKKLGPDFSYGITDTGTLYLWKLLKDYYKIHDTVRSKFISKQLNYPPVVETSEVLEEKKKPFTDPYDGFRDSSLIQTKEIKNNIFVVNRDKLFTTFLPTLYILLNPENMLGQEDLLIEDMEKFYMELLQYMGWTTQEEKQKWLFKPTREFISFFLNNLKIVFEVNFIVCFIDGPPLIIELKTKEKTRLLYLTFKQTGEFNFSPVFYKDKTYFRNIIYNGSDDEKLFFDKLKGFDTTEEIKQVESAFRNSGKLEYIDSFTEIENIKNLFVFVFPIIAGKLANIALLLNPEIISEPNMTKHKLDSYTENFEDKYYKEEDEDKTLQKIANEYNVNILILEELNNEQIIIECEGNCIIQKALSKKIINSNTNSDVYIILLTKGRFVHPVFYNAVKKGTAEPGYGKFRNLKLPGQNPSERMVLQQLKLIPYDPKDWIEEKLEFEIS